MKQTYLLIALLFYFVPISGQTFTLKNDELSGQAFNKHVLNGLGGKGENKSPQLFWENSPTGPKSFVLNNFDENAPTGSGCWHWLIFDIPANLSALKSGAANLKLAPKSAIQNITGFIIVDFSGSCPPE